MRMKHTLLAANKLRVRKARVRTYVHVQYVSVYIPQISLGDLERRITVVTGTTGLKSLKTK